MHTRFEGVSAVVKQLCSAVGERIVVAFPPSGRSWHFENSGADCSVRNWWERRRGCPWRQCGGASMSSGGSGVVDGDDAQGRKTFWLPLLSSPEIDSGNRTAQHPLARGVL